MLDWEKQADFKAISLSLFADRRAYPIAGCATLFRPDTQNRELKIHGGHAMCVVGYDEGRHGGAGCDRRAQKLIRHSAYYLPRILAPARVYGNFPAM